MTMRKNHSLLCYFGHHKCATVWIHGMLTMICNLLSLKIEYVHSHNQFNSDLETFVRSNHIDFLTYANANIDFVSKLEAFKGFHVIRDPRDIAVSSYFSHLHSHPTANWEALVRHREKLRQVTKAEGLILDIEFIHQNVFNYLEKWNYNLPDVMEIRMEELTREPYMKFTDIFDFLGIVDKKNPGPPSPGTNISLEELNKIVGNRSFEKISGGRKPGEEDVGHHFRKGIAGDWKNHFDEDHKKYFKEKYNNLLIKLGYEKDDNW